MSIPVDDLIGVYPGVVAAGGSNLALNGLVLTANTRVPIGQVLSFPSQIAVSAYFGAGSAEATAASTYFLGFDGSTAKPGAMLFAQYPWAAPVAAYLRGGSLAGMTLTTLQALTGVLTVTVNGTPYTSSTISLGAATSFTSAATIIQTAMGFGGAATVTYDSVSSAFVVTSSTTGTGSTISIGSGTIAASLALTAATGAVTSQGAAIATPAAAMAAIVAVAQNWFTFSTMFYAVTADQVNFAAWANSTGNKYGYVGTTTDVTLEAPNPSSSAPYLVAQSNYSGTFFIWDAGGTYKAQMVQGFLASINFTQAGGRTTLAYLSQTGQTPDVTTQAVKDQLVANGVNCYGLFGPANQQFQLLQNGQVSGPFAWMDSFANQRWLNSNLQLTALAFLAAVGSVPYNPVGYGEIAEVFSGPINAAVSFGAIVPGVVLSASQIAAVNAAAGGRNIAPVIVAQGWYLLVADPGATVRAARGSPLVILWYSDGGSIQTINLSSLLVQ